MDQTERLVTRTPGQTQDFFQAFAGQLKPGDVVGFIGELGAGKTLAIQSILNAFGLSGGESPTFIMIHPYDLARPIRGIQSIVHVDAYRFETRKEALTSGLTDVLADPTALVLVEWADRIHGLLPKRTILVAMEHAGGDARVITVQRP